MCLYIANNETTPSSPAAAENSTGTQEQSEQVQESRIRISSDILEELKATYAKKRTSPTRIRIQSSLSEIPSEALPIEQLLEEIADLNAPTPYKLFLARTLRNGAKAEPKPSSRQKIVARLLSTIEVPNTPENLIAGLALALIDIDDSVSTIQRLSALLDRITDDNHTAATLNAIARSNSPDAKAALLKFVQSEADSQTPRTLALSEALIPLSYEQDSPIEETLLKIVSTTQDTRLFEASLHALKNRNPSETKTQAITIAQTRATSFPKEIQPSLFHLTQLDKAASSPL